tara:strand:- start:4399 stop:5634 length:1236 start_codon:yes stop_codon:yes gene_type:complete
MPQIKPFKGFLPPHDLAETISSPPYDVISENEARLIIKLYPHSFLRVIKPEIDFNSKSNLDSFTIHKRAKENLNNLIETKKLIQDEQESFYLYQIKQNSHIQTGIVATVSVDEYDSGIIKKHELTRPDKEDDRTMHINITNANTGPVFLTFKNDLSIQKILETIIIKKPSLSFQLKDKTLHKIWRVNSKQNIDKLINYFKQIDKFYIADGHHRAASASRVQKLRITNNKHHKGNEHYNYFLSVIFPDDEMNIIDYNRVVDGLNGLSVNKLITALKTHFDVNILPRSEKPNIPHNFSMYIDGKWYLLKTKNNILSKDPINNLDASILQNYILGPILNIKNPRTNNNIEFVGGIKGLEGIEKKCNTKTKVGFVLHPVLIDDLFKVSDLNKIMPPKSTWFEPKLRSGLIVRLLD